MCARDAGHGGTGDPNPQGCSGGKLFYREPSKKVSD